jgi:peptidoglycan/LPS O-acetylase OafA/YrhL
MDPEKHSYITQLDALRAISVLMVLFYHWLPYVTFLHTHQIGPYGVSVFFVLSGFLITRGLLVDKDYVEADKYTVANRFKNFILKRSLRIFPIYYLLLAFLFALNFETIRSEIYWHLFYSSNILYFVNCEFSNGLAHLRSLAVEEQFYIIWPSILLLIPKKHLLTTLLICILLGSVIFFLLADVTRGTLLMPARIDAFAWGGLLAYALHRQHDILTRFFLSKWILISSSMLFLAAELDIFSILNPLKQPLFYLSVTCIIIVLCYGVKGWAGGVLSCSPLLYLGKISYGIYLYHNVMQWLLPYFFKLVHIPFPDNEWIKFSLLLIVTLIVSTVSYNFIEKPILRLKTRISHA